MKLGIQVPQTGRYLDRGSIERIGRAAEDAGIGSLWLSDHIVVPIGGASSYPYGSGETPFAPDDGYLECLSTMAFLAGVTERVELGALVVVPMRETLLLAKTLATIQALSAGRATAAFAAGWWREEFDALGVDFDTRGPRMDEQIEAMIAVWTNGRDERRGRFVKYPEVAVEPRPPDGPLPIWIAGKGTSAWRRIAQFGAGWHGVGYSPADIAEAVKELAVACDRVGRTDPVPMSTTTGLPTDPARAHARVADLERAGLSQVVFIAREPTLDGTLRSIDLIAEVLLPDYSD